ncbi:AAA family ATPase [Aliarcobacter cryaerophilus]|uniref:McrB family protein n=1 Tax=Aliarcobacter cryaerophilus TaxID=28198 RepID=UPI003DA44CBB
MYSNFDFVDKVMLEKGFSPCEIVNLNDHNKWSYTKSEVAVFSKPLDGSRTTGSFQFELKGEILSTLPIQEYDNYFFSENLNHIAKSTFSFFKNSKYFPLNTNSILEQLRTMNLSDDLSIFKSSFRNNGGRYYLSTFNNFQKHMFINFVTKFKIKLYKNITTNQFVFFWLINNNILIDKAKIDLISRYNSYISSGISNPNTEELYKTLIEILEKIELKHTPRNLIVYGPPGTGKSHYLDDMTSCFQNVYTVTFHPDYDYSDFIGTYKPKSIICKDDTQDTDMCKSKVIYTFVPGILIKVIKKAIENPDENIILKIEEINRGNTATIFGDIFQLLDRNEDGESKYSIEASDEIYDFLKVKKIKIPKNLYILATMNTSDQSLYPMDSAFKRRWTWKHIPIDLNDAKKLIIKIDGIKDINWSEFIEKINKKILNITDSEDKQLGNRFVNPLKNEINIDTFVGKVLFYLWSDIFKHEDHFDENNIFKSLKKDTNSSSERISFSLLYNTDGTVNIEIIKKLLKDLEFDLE